MNLKSASKIQIAFLAALVFLLSLSIISYNRIKNLVQSGILVNHSGIVKLELEKTFVNLRDAGTNQRGYVLTADTAYLHHFYQSEGGVKFHLKTLDSLTRDNPAQQQHLQILKTFVDKRLDYLKLHLNDKRNTEVTQKEWLIAKAQLDDVRAEIDRMIAVENHLLNSRNREMRRAELITPFVTVVLIVSCLLVLLVAYYKINDDLKVARSLQQQLANRTQELEKNLKELSSQKTISETLLNQLKKTEETYHRMVDEVQDYAIIFLNRDGIIQNWNKGAEKIKGYTAKEIIGEKFTVFYAKEDREQKLPQQLITEALLHGRAIHEGWRVRKNGTKFWGSVVMAAVHDNDQNIIGFTKVTRDLTEKKITEDQLKANAAQLQQQNNILAQKNAELTQFAYVSSHDLQEPLRKIQTFATRILEKNDLAVTPLVSDYLLRIQNAAQRMQTLIEDLLAYSRTSSDERKFELSDLNMLVQEVVTELGERIAEKNAVVTFNPMPSIKIIPFQFHQLLTNLINNSLKFSREHVSPDISITGNIIPADEITGLTDADYKNYFHLSVKDNGIGFEQEYSKKIFEVFQRLHGRMDYKGTGIGLAICKKIVENHHGIITADSSLGAGAVFNVYIPLG